MRQDIKAKQSGRNRPKWQIVGVASTELNEIVPPESPPRENNKFLQVDTTPSKTIVAVSPKRTPDQDAVPLREDFDLDSDDDDDDDEDFSRSKPYQNMDTEE